MYKELSETWDALIAEGSPFEITEVEVRGQSHKEPLPRPRRPCGTCGCSPPSSLTTITWFIRTNESPTPKAHRRVASIANWLQAKGVEVGDRVAIAMRNYPEWLLSYWAITSIGAAVVGVNAWWVGPGARIRSERFSPQGADRRSGTARAGPGTHRCAAAHEVCRRADLPALPGGCGALVRAGRARRRTAGRDGRSGFGCLHLLYLGTTGHPKGAQLTHRGCTNNIMNLAFSAGLMTAYNERMGNPVPAPDPDGPQPAGLVTTRSFPRHRQQLRRPRHDVERRQAGAHVQVGSTGGPEADRAGEDCHLYRRADHGPGADQPSGVSQLRHLHPAIRGRRWRAAAAGSGRQDR